MRHLTSLPARGAVALAVVCLVSMRCASSTPPEAGLAPAIDRIIAAPPLRNALWGVRVEDAAGRVLYEQNAHALFMPASNRKLFSAAAAAECLGIDARLETTLHLEGDDVVVRGNGDPSFGAVRHESPGFEPFVAALRARGITRVRDVIVDVSRFDRNLRPGSWKSGNLMWDYAAPVDAIAFEENAIGDYAVADAALYAGTRFREALAFGGIEADGVVRVRTAPVPETARIASVSSPFVNQLLWTVLKNSHNLYAEMLLKAIGDGTYESALARERAFLTSGVGIDGEEFRFVDGSGLAPDDLVTPAAIVAMVRWLDAPERRRIWWPILAQPGGEGTLRRRLTNLGGRVRAKTGTIGGVNSLSGVVAGERGERRFFSILVNHHTAESASEAIDAIVQEIAKF